MAFGFTPTFKSSISLENLPHGQALAAAANAVQIIGWQLQYISASGLIAYTNNGILKWNGKITLKFNGDAFEIQSQSTGNEMVDWGRNKKAVEKFTGAFLEVVTQTAPDVLLATYQNLLPHLTPPESDVLGLPPATAADNAKSVLAFFIPRQGYFITPVLININLALFILQACTGVNVFEPDTQSLLNWGANLRQVTLAGQWWRLITCCFLHIGIFHLLLNMYALVYIGLLLEPFLNKTRFAVAYILTGIAASTASLAWHDNTVSAGASGAIFGMYGVFLALLTTNIIEKSARKDLLTSIAIFVVYNLMYGMKGGIDNAAHIGGLLSGIVIGYAFYPGLKKGQTAKSLYITCAALAILVTGASYTVMSKTSNDIGLYEEKMNKISSYEETALAFYRLPQNATQQQQLAALKDSGIHNWQNNLALVDDIDKLNLPDKTKEYNRYVRQYCQLRLNEFNLLYNTISNGTGNTATSGDSLLYYRKAIEAVVKQLKAK